MPLRQMLLMILGFFLLNFMRIVDRPLLLHVLIWFGVDLLLVHLLKPLLFSLLLDRIVICHHKNFAFANNILVGILFMSSFYHRNITLLIITRVLDFWIWRIRFSVYLLNIAKVFEICWFFRPWRNPFMLEAWVLISIFETIVLIVPSLKGLWRLA